MADCATADVTSSSCPSTTANAGDNCRQESEPETAPSSSCVCRDFLRNVCRRGDRCRFLHPADPTAARRDVIAAAHHRPLVFCHDFQNATGCKRGTSCRFAHCTRDEEATYRRTGLLPVHVHRKLALDAAIAKSLLRGETPVCLDFIKAGGCRRANGKCRYRHVTAAEFEREQLAVDDQQMSLQCATELESYVPQSTTTAAAALIYRKRKLTMEDNGCDDVVLYGSKLGCAGNSFNPVTSSTCAVSQLVAVIEPVRHLPASHWTTTAALHDFRSPFCVGRPCRLVAVPAAATVAFNSGAIQQPIHLALSPSGVAMVTPATSSTPLGRLPMMQPYV